MTILKGRDFEMAIVLTNCHTDIDISGITDFVCYFYTKEGGAAIERSKDQFTWDETGTIGTTILTGTELNGLDDGVLRYQFEADEQVVKRTTNYYLKTPVDFSGQTYTTEEDVESIVDSMTEDFITDTEAEHMIEEALSGATGKKAYILSDMTQTELATLYQQILNEVGNDQVNPGQDNSGATINDKYDFYYTFPENRVCYRLQYCGFLRPQLVFTGVVGAQSGQRGRITVMKVYINAQGIIGTKYITDYNLDTISGGSIESYVFTPEVGAQIWAKYSGLTVDELNARVRVLSPAGYEMVCISKTTNPDQFNFRGSGIYNNGSYWVLSEAEAWARETGSFGRDWWNAAPQHMYIYTTDRTISKSRSGSRLPVPLGWHTIVRGLKNGASFTGVVDASDDNDLAGMNSANVQVIVNSTFDNAYTGNITIIADFYSATDSAFVKASWTVDYNNLYGTENITLNYWNILS